MSPPDSLTSIGSLAAGGQPSASPLPISNLIEQHSTHAFEAATAPRRLRLFHRSYGQIVGELSLTTLLQRVPDLAREVVGARYATLSVVGLDGHLDHCPHSQLSRAETEAIGEAPQGRGLLATMVEDPLVAHLPGVLDSPHSCGAPPSHPVAERFLGVPVRYRGDLYAILHLTEQVTGRDFDSADEELTQALAAAASIAIENALLYQESRRRQEWLEAAADLGQYLLGSQDDAATALRRTVSTVRELLGADTAALLILEEDGADLTVLAVEGEGSEALLGRQLTARGSVATAALRQGRGISHDPQQVEPGEETELGGPVPTGPVLALPMNGQADCSGVVIAIRRPGRLPFTQPELEMAETFAGQAAVVLQLVQARGDRNRLSGMEQRDQIASSLHGDVVQRLVGIGLGVSETAQQVDEPEARGQLLHCMAEIGETIREIRSSIFTLLAAPPAALPLSGMVTSLVAEIQTGLGLPVELELVGPLEWPAEAGLVRDIEAVLRESLTNVSKYAHASSVTVCVRTDGSSLELSVTDDGRGLQGSTRRSGLDNLGRRAERYGGQLSIDNRTEGGLQLTWAIPL